MTGYVMPQWLDHAYRGTLRWCLARPAGEPISRGRKTVLVGLTWVMGALLRLGVWKAL